MKVKLKNSTYSISLILFFLCALAACRAKIEQGHIGQAAQAPHFTPSPASNIKSDVGFRTPRHFEEHYEKHGREFGTISAAEYLRQAQILRDATVGGEILEARRGDGVITRFDRQAGSFLAFDQDLTIRTFFKPNDGERYFKRQLAR